MTVINCLLSDESMDYADEPDTDGDIRVEFTLRPEGAGNTILYAYLRSHDIPKLHNALVHAYLDTTHSINTEIRFVHNSSLYFTAVGIRNMEENYVFLVFHDGERNASIAVAPADLLEFILTLRSAAGVPDSALNTELDEHLQTKSEEKIRRRGELRLRALSKVYARDYEELTAEELGVLPVLADEGFITLDTTSKGDSVVEFHID